jgi:hypothetical protein
MIGTCARVLISPPGSPSSAWNHHTAINCQVGKRLLMQFSVHKTTDSCSG